MEELNITPTKRILWAGVSECNPANAITEIQDNLIDHVSDRFRKGTLAKRVMKSDFELSCDVVRIRWNLGIPENKRMPLLKPGLQLAEEKATIGTWSQGGKIAIHAFGDDITIRTCTPDDEKCINYHFPSNWLVDENGEYNRKGEVDWKVIQSYEQKPKDDDFTEIVIKNPSKKVKELFEDKSGEAFSNMMIYVGETYGLTFHQFAVKGIKFDMRINGKVVKLIKYSTPEIIQRNLNRMPGFEPTAHVYDYNGLKIKIVVGCTNKMEADESGMYIYGNHGRLFARREKDSRYLDEIDVTHPQKKHWQLHIFFSGDTNLIPWSSPLKTDVNYNHETMTALKPILNKLPRPYIELVTHTHAPERQIFSEKYLMMKDDEKKSYIRTFFGKSGIDYDFDNYSLLDKEGKKGFIDGIWKQLPQMVRKGRPYNTGIIEGFQHGNLIDAIKERIREREPKWSLSASKKWLSDHDISQKSTRTIKGKISALWAFNEFIDALESATSGNTEIPSVDEVDDAGERVVISGRIKISDKKLIGREAGSDKPTDVVLYLVEKMFPLVKILLSCPKLPDGVKSAPTDIDKLKLLIKSLGGNAEGD